MAQTPMRTILDVLAFAFPWNYTCYGSRVKFTFYQNLPFISISKSFPPARVTSSSICVASGGLITNRLSDWRNAFREKKDDASLPFKDQTNLGRRLDSTTITAVPSLQQLMASDHLIVRPLLIIALTCHHEAKNERLHPIKKISTVPPMARPIPTSQT